MTTVTVHVGELGILWSEVCCILGCNVVSWSMEIGFTIHFSLLYDAMVFTFSCTITGTTFLQFNHVAQPAGTVLLSCSTAMAADVRLVCQGLPSTILW